MDHSPSWSPDGKWIAFDSNRDGVSQIFIVRADGGGVRRLTDLPASASSARWMGDGRRISFLVTQREEQRRFSAGLDGSDLREEAMDSVTSVAKNGVRLFASSMGGGPAAIYSLDTTGAVTRLTAGAHAEEASYAPDGSSIVYEEWPRGELPRIIVMRPDGSRARRIALGTAPSWSPDGNVILLKTEQGNNDPLRRQIATIRPDGSGLRTYGEDVHMRFSPDGRQIVCMARNAAGTARVWMMSSDGSGKWCLTCAT